MKSSVKIVELMLANRSITIPELAEMLNLSTRTIEKQIVNLKENKIIERIGPNKGGYWEVLDTPPDE